MADIALTANEQQLFNEAHTVPDYIMNKNSDAYVIETSKRVLKDMIMKAKGELNRPFGGAKPATSQLGFAPLEPWHMGASNTWTGHFGTLGWITAPSTSELPWSNVTVRPDTWVGIIGFEDLNTQPKVDKIQITVGNETRVPRDISYIRHAPGNRILLQTRPIIIVPRSTMSVAIKVSQTGYHQFKPIGWAVTIGSNLSKKSYYTT